MHQKHWDLHHCYWFQFGSKDNPPFPPLASYFPEQSSTKKFNTWEYDKNWYMKDVKNIKFLYVDKSGSSR